LNKDDGIMTVYDMNEHEELKFYNEDKYWNMDLKEEFVGQTTNLWRGNFDDKRNGSIIVSRDALASQEESLMIMKVRNEMEAAVTKHGKVTLPKAYNEEFQE